MVGVWCVYGPSSYLKILPESFFRFFYLLAIIMITFLSLPVRKYNHCKQQQKSFSPLINRWCDGWMERLVFFSDFSCRKFSRKSNMQTNMINILLLFRFE